MIDLHSHILAGVDDGARTIEESREIARRAELEGVTAIVATPHVRDDWPTTADEMERTVAALRADLAAERIEVEILTGGELSLEFVRTLGREELSRFTLAGTGRYLLLECQYMGWPLALEQTLFELRLRGMTAVLAHPERNPDAQVHPGLVETAVRAGALVQVTAASVDGRLGRKARATARELLRLGLVHVLASDAHSVDVRKGTLATAAAELADEGLARYLTEEAPAAIVAGEAVPPPRVATKRRGRFRL